MIIFILEKIRKVLKSIGKLEFKIIDKLILLKNENKKYSSKSPLKYKDLENIETKLNKNQNFPKKLVIVICFYFKKNKLKILEKTISEISLYKFKNDIKIITNKLTGNQKKTLKKIIKKKLKYFSIQEINNIPETNFLPWYSLNVMRQKYKDKKNSHFMFIEDDILVNSRNITYWICFRKILKKYGLIPSFLRYEKYKKKYFSVDNPKKIKIKDHPTIQTVNKKFGFINSKFPYHAMYLMDRELMGKFLESDSVKIDFSFTNRIMRMLYPIKELANISYAYIDTPEGYHNNLMIPFNEDNKIPNYCLVEHCDLKYINLKKFNKMGYGTIDIDNLII